MKQAGPRVWTLVVCAVLAGAAAPGCRDGGEPGHIGTLEVDPAQAQIRSEQEWTLSYEAGPGGVREGGAISLRVWPEWGWEPPQLARPGRAGHVSWTVPGGGAVFRGEIRRIERARLDGIVLRLAEGRLGRGERLVIRYASRAAPFAGEARQFLVEVDADGDGVFAPLAAPPLLRVTPGTPGSLWVVASGPAAADEPARARASVLDRWDNLVRTRAVEGSAPFVQASDPESGLEGRSSRVWPPPQGPHQLFWGDVHGHSAWSDGTGQPADYYTYARDAAALDFAALTDHDAIGPHVLDADTWTALRNVADTFNESGRFVTLFGYEYTNWDTGHLTILSPSRELPVFSAADPATDRVEELTQKLAALEFPVLAVPHHPGGSTMPFDWEHFDPRFMHVVEIFSVHGSSECYECPIRVQQPRRGSSVRDALLRGYRLSFIGSGDTHNGHPGRRTRRQPRRTGLVGVWAEALSRDAIWEALAGGRSFATTGSRTEARLERDGAGGLHALVRAAGRVASAEILKRDRVVHRVENAGPSLRLDWVDAETPAPGDFYYLRVTEADGHMAWTSPLYVP